MSEKLINWQKKWETGIKTIDDQHKHFVLIINRTYALDENGKDKKVLGDILNELTEYVRIHFSTEEGYFDDTEYPESDEHKQKHQELLEKVLKFNQRFEKEEDVSGLVKDFLIFLRSWLDDHLIKCDHKYIPWLTEHGVK